MEHTLEMTFDPIWDSVDRLHTWLDQESNRPAEQKTPSGLLKLSNEVGVVARSLAGATCPAE
ncbi:hypothetical protein [Streptomyces sp. NPDC005953]|uniref:hypothetical protein n=1 Tax=unclassified Streptomyces TaxID=2593676 RepID=UPI00340F0883